MIVYTKTLPNEIKMKKINQNESIDLIRNKNNNSNPLIRKTWKNNLMKSELVMK